MSLTHKYFLLNFNLDVLHGCRWSCDGCYVNTTGQNGFAEGDLDRFIPLIENFQEKGYDPSLLVVGPTDVFTAHNSVAVLTDQKFIELVKPFKRLTFISTFLATNDDVTATLNEHHSDKEIEFKLLIEAVQFGNDKYLHRVRDNMLHTRESLNMYMPVHPQFNLFEYDATKLSGVLGDYEALNKRSYEYFDQGIDYVLSFSRSEKLTKEQKLGMLKWIQEMFNKHVTPENAEYIHFDTGNPIDFQERIFSYRNGEFYHAPKVYDEYIAFDPEFRIPVTEWNAEEFEQFEMNKLVNQYQHIHNKPCATCVYAPTCTDRGIPWFMDHIGTNECLMPKDAFDVVNGGA